METPAATAGRTEATARGTARRSPPQARVSLGRHRGVAIDRSGEFDILECETCRFVHVVPLPAPETLEAEYRHDYYTREKPLYIETRQRDLNWWRRVHAERYRLLEASLAPERRSLLEIGSGPGVFLQVGRDRGWKVRGVEPSRQAAAHSRAQGLDVIEELFDEAIASRLGRYDAVQMTDVLEHLPDPARTLRTVHGVLEPGGLLGVVVPNDYNPFQRALCQTRGFQPWWLAPPHHLNYFNFESLSGLLASSGFEVIVHASSFPIDLFLMMGDDYVADAPLGRHCHERRMRLEQTLHEAGLDDLKSDLYQAFARLGLGREIVLVARRLPSGQGSGAA